MKDNGEKCGSKEQCKVDGAECVETCQCTEDTYFEGDACLLSKWDTVKPDVRRHLTYISLSRKSDVLLLIKLATFSFKTKTVFVYER